LFGLLTVKNEGREGGEGGEGREGEANLFMFPSTTNIKQPPNVEFSFLQREVPVSLSILVVVAGQ
jgi:hypothetical protein